MAAVHLVGQPGLLTAVTGGCLTLSFSNCSRRGKTIGQPKDNEDGMA